jgi:hypothetical protein
MLIFCRLFAFTDASGKTKPGMIYVTDGSGAAIDLEVWEMPIENFGDFMLQVRTVFHVPIAHVSATACVPDLTQLCIVCVCRSQHPWE